MHKNIFTQTVFSLVLGIVLICTSNDETISQTKLERNMTNISKNSYQSVLEAEEITCIELIGQLCKIVQDNTMPEKIQEKSREMLQPLWGDISSSGLTVTYMFSGAKNKNVLTTFILSTPSGNSITLIFRGGDKLFLNSASITGKMPALFKSQNFAKLALDFSKNGHPVSIIFANEKGDLVNKIVRWDENGSLLSNELLKKPRALNIDIRK